MSKYLEKLKSLYGNTSSYIGNIQPSKPSKVTFDGFDGFDGSNEDVEGTHVISNWWLVHFDDASSVMVAIWPPCDYECVIKLNPGSVFAEPIYSPIA